MKLIAMVMVMMLGVAQAGYAVMSFGSKKTRQAMDCVMFVQQTCGVGPECVNKNYACNVEYAASDELYPAGSVTRDNADMEWLEANKHNWE